jgi:hypothetical protein
MQSVPWVEEDHELCGSALAALFERIGPAGVLITHSRGGYTGWVAAMKSKDVKAVISYEPV